MKLLNRNPATVKQAIFIMTLTMLTPCAYADDSRANLKKMCDRQSLVIAAELRKKANNELTAQDMKMIRIGAINACIETYKKMSNSSDYFNADTSPQGIATETKVEKNETKKEKESIFDRLLRTESKEPVNPMQKKHRTGGK